MSSILNFIRLLKIITILYKRGALFLLRDLGVMPNFIISALSIFSFQSRSISRGKRIKLILHDLGPFFIKFGQTLATRPDLVGEEVAHELSELQDRVPSIPHPDIDRHIKQELGKSISELFSEFNKTPVATASIAMVFKAKDLDGNKVAVKVLKPNIEKEFARDIKLFFWIARIVERRFANLKRLKPLEVVRTFDEITKQEMDLRMEAAASSELKDNHRNDKGIYVPKVYWLLTSKAVLTMEWIDGIPIYDTAKLKKHGLDLNKITQNFTFMFLNQAYRDGFFHADLHPGNIFIMKNGDIGLIDFGIMGRLDRKTKVYLAEILIAFFNRDYDRIAKIHFDAGYVPRHKSMWKFSQSCRAVGEPIVGLQASNISVGKLLAHLFQITKDFEMETQPQLLLIQKTTVVVEGICMKLTPSVNMWEVAAPWIREWSEKNLKFDSKIVNAINDFVEFLNCDLKDFIKRTMH